MRGFLISIALVILVVLFTHAAEIYVDDDQLPEVSSSTLMVLYFHADWCPYCRVFKPTWDEAANRLENDFSIVFVRIDVDKSPGLAQQFKIPGVPVLFLYQNGNIIAGPTKLIFLMQEDPGFRPWNPEELLQFIKENKKTPMPVPGRSV